MFDLQEESKMLVRMQMALSVIIFFIFIFLISVTGGAVVNKFSQDKDDGFNSGRFT